MPNEPCANMECISRDELEKMRQQLDDLLDTTLEQREQIASLTKERDEWRSAERRAEDGCNELMELLHKAETERDELKAAVAGKDLTLQKVLGYIDEFCCHFEDYQGGGERTRDVGELDCDRKAIGNIVVPTLSPTLGADILQKMREQDAAVATMRTTLDMANVTLLGLCEDCEDALEGGCKQRDSCTIWQQSIEIEKALHSDIGVETLEYIKGLEAVVEAAIRLRKVRDKMNVYQSASSPEIRETVDVLMDLWNAIDALLKGGGEDA